MSLSWTTLRYPSDVTLETLAAGLCSLAAEGRSSAKTPNLVFECDLEPTAVTWRIGGEQAALRRFVAGLQHQLQGIEARPIEHGPQVHPTTACELRLDSSRRPLDVSAADSLAFRLLSLSSRLRRTERVRLQWVVRGWLPRSPIPSAANQRVERTLWNLPDWGRPVLDGEAVAQARNKQSEPVLASVGRVAVWASSLGRARQLTGEVIGSYQLLRAPGVGISKRWLPPSCVVSRMSRLVVPRLDPPCRLTPSELAAVIGWPIGNPDLPTTSYVRSRVVAADPRSLAPPDGLTKERVLGESTATERPGLLVMSQESSTRHLHVAGRTGSGKSWLLANLVLSDLTANRRVVVIDAKGDLLSDIISRLPQRLWSKVVLLDPTDEAPVGFNPLAGDETDVDGLVHVMRSVWPSWGPRLGDVLHASSLTLARLPGHSLAELPLLLTDDAFRRSVVGKVTANDPWLGSFWGWYEALSEDARAQVLAPVMSRLRSFLLRPALRSVLGQNAPRLDVRNVFHGGPSLLVRLNRGVLGPEGAQLLGSMVVGSLWQAALARSSEPPERRQPIHLVLDEFQEFLRLNVDLTDALAQARGLGVGLTLAHQHFGQLDRATRDAVLGNVGSRVVFALDHDDAALIARRSGDRLQPEDVANLDRYEAYASVLVDGSSAPYASMRTRGLPPVISDVRRFETVNRKRYGTSASDTEARLRSLIDEVGGPEPGGVLGGKRRPGGQP
jgi:hypothetical protein